MENTHSQCPICFDICPNSSTFSLPCGSSCCLDCLTQWSLSKIREQQLQFEDAFLCVISSCEKSLKIEQIYPHLSPHHKEQIDQALLHVYLNKTPDIRRCPSSQCSYAGIIPTTSSCTELLECAGCGTNWKDQSSSKDNTKLWKNFTNEFFSFLWKKLRTKKCPNCKIAIQKMVDVTTCFAKNVNMNSAGCA